MICQQLHTMGGGIARSSEGLFSVNTVKVWRIRRNENCHTKRFQRRFVEKKTRVPLQFIVLFKQLLIKKILPPKTFRLLGAIDLLFN